MTTPSPRPSEDSRRRAKAIQHALVIEEQKKLKSQVLDLVLEAYDLPSRPVSSPADASSDDVRLFKTCLSLFQPSDFDDLIRERNIDDRCGYALCSNPNKKITHGGNKVWNGKGGPEFRMVHRSELEKWCSQECEQRAVFGRLQLSDEPAWLRDSQKTPEHFKLLDEVAESDGMVDALQTLAIEETDTDKLNAKLKALTLERGKSNPHSTRPRSFAIVEKDSASANAPALFDEDSIEGHKPRQVRFADKPRSSRGSEVSLTQPRLIQTGGTD